MVVSSDLVAAMVKGAAHGDAVQNRLKIVLGIALLLASGAILAKSAPQRRAARRPRPRARGEGARTTDRDREPPGSAPPAPEGPPRLAPSGGPPGGERGPAWPAG